MSVIQLTVICNLSLVQLTVEGCIKTVVVAFVYITVCNI